MDITILYEDRVFLVLNKPAGLIVHGDGKTKGASVSEWLLSHYPGIKNVGEPWISQNGETIHRPGIVHRLDKDTSGVLAIAKDQDTFNFLKSQFKQRTVDKIYHAFVYGEVKEDGGTIDRPIARSRKDFRLWSAQRGARGEAREAVTQFRVIKRGNGFSFLEVCPKTGRTHQIRVHLKAINHPVVCDALYAPKRECSLGFKRLALHASSLTLTMPNEKKETFKAEFPQDFEGAIKLLS